MAYDTTSASYDLFFDFHGLACGDGCRGLVKRCQRVMLEESKFRLVSLEAGGARV